ncbi:MAG: ABC transporter permease subunit [Zoogloea sp.]|nr:ABC transporter permease subunit [Zoogloea sp.]
MRNCATSRGRSLAAGAGWLALALAGGVLLWLAARAVGSALGARGVQFGFDFLAQPAGFSIGESPIPFQSTDSYLRAFAVGLANTLRVALPGILAATALGALAGFGRLSSNLLLRGACTAYVELFRNVPLLLQLFAWYSALIDLLPMASEPLQLAPHVLLSKSGLALPWLTGGALDLPERGAVTVSGGATLTPEYLALLIGLVCYTGAYIAETVRAGIEAIPRGQQDAALALGLRRSQVFRLVLLPQALRSILPAMTNQYLNLSKNASLAVAIGYPDLVSVANTALNQTGRAVECISIIMAVYLLLSLATAHASRWLERRTGAWARQ